MELAQESLTHDVNNAVRIIKATAFCTAVLISLATSGMLYSASLGSEDPTIAATAPVSGGILSSSMSCSIFVLNVIVWRWGPPLLKVIEELVESHRANPRTAPSKLVSLEAAKTNTEKVRRLLP